MADDPDNVRNLAGDPAFADVIARHRAENDRHLLAIRDSVFYPEGMRGRKWAAYQDDVSYPLQRLIALASAVSEQDSEHIPAFKTAMADANPLIRYWGIAGCVTLGGEAAELKDDLIARLQDEDEIVRLHAARALAGMGAGNVALPTIREALADSRDDIRVLRALLAIDECGLLALDLSLREQLAAKGSYGKRVIDKLLRDSSDKRGRP